MLSLLLHNMIDDGNPMAHDNILTAITYDTHYDSNLRTLVTFKHAYNLWQWDAFYLTAIRI